MTTGKTNPVVNIETKLAHLNLTPAQRTQALGAMKVAEEMVDFFHALGAVVKRIAGVVSLKPSIRT